MNITKEQFKEIVKKHDYQKYAAKELKICVCTFRRLKKKFKIKTDFDPYKLHRSNLKLICKNCNKEFKVTKSESKKRKFCSRICSITYNKGPRSEKTKRKISKAISKKGPWNKGKKLVKHITKKCPMCNKTYETHLCDNRIYCSRKCYTKDHDHKYRKAAPGGLRKGSSFGKCGWYKGYWCDSSYELAFVIYNLDHNIQFKRNKEYFLYIYKNKEYKYYPDFIIDNKLIEIKGFKDKKTDLKINAVRQLGKNIDILYKEDLKYIFDYVTKKYTNNFIQMYDNYKPKYTYICNNCKKEFKTDSKRKTERKFCSRKCINMHI